MELTFECLENNRWYVVHPEYEGMLEELAVEGNAAKMLDALTTDGLYVTLDVTSEEPSNYNFFTLALEYNDDKGALYNVLDCPQFSGTIWLSNAMQTIFRENTSKIYCTIINSGNQQKGERLNGKESDSAQKADRERHEILALMYETLYNLGCMPSIDNNGIMSVQYRDVTFGMFFGNDHVRIWEFNWAKAREDDPYMPIIRESVNSANLSAGPTVVMSEANENGIIMFCSRRVIMSHAVRSGNEVFVKAVLDSFFDVKERAQRIFLQLKAARYN